MPIRDKNAQKNYNSSYYREHRGDIKSKALNYYHEHKDEINARLREKRKKQKEEQAKIDRENGVWDF